VGVRRVSALLRLVACVALIVALPFLGASCAPQRTVQEGRVSGTIYSSTRMADGKQRMTENLGLDVPGSYCYGDVEQNCRRYGRLYTWDSAQRGCQSLGDGWRPSVSIVSPKARSRWRWR
jgi:hypothetical protein